jgi:hypothetical protein
MLLEFLGSHEVIWAAIDSVEPLNLLKSVGKQKQSSSSHFSEFISMPNNNKVCNKEILDSAVTAISWWKSYYFSNGEVEPEDLDLVELPSIEHLQASIETSTSIFENQNSEKRQPIASLKKKKPLSVSKEVDSIADSKKKKIVETEIIQIPVNISTYNPSSHSSVDYDNYIFNNSFVVSRCPSLESIMTEGNGKTNYVRNNGIFKTIGVIYWMEKVKPLNFKHYKATKPTTMKESSSSSNKSTITSTRSTAKTVTGAATVIPQSGIGAKLDGPPEKRKYVFKNRAATSSSGKSNFDLSLSAPLQVTAASAASAFVLNTGCSKFLVGEGVVYTRVVDLKDQVFHLESNKREDRKAILRLELEALKASIDQLQAAAKIREADRAGLVAKHSQPPGKVTPK